MTMARAVREVQRATHDDAIVVTGAGLPQGMVKQRWVTRRPRTHLTSGGFSTMGFTLPAAIGAQLAKPDREVLAICGDGDFLQTMQELQAAVLAGAPVCAIVLDNSGWISIKGGQQAFFGRSAWTDFLTPGRLDLLAGLRRHRRGVRDPQRARRRSPTRSSRRSAGRSPPAGRRSSTSRSTATSTVAGPDKTGWWDAPSPENHPEQHARWLDGPGGGAAPMTVASPPSAVVEQAERLRRQLAVGGPLAGARIGTVPILWNNVDLAGAPARDGRGHRSSTTSPGPATREPSSGSTSRRATRCGRSSPRAACASRRSTPAFAATVDGPADGSLERVRERIRLLRDGRRRGALHRLRRDRRSGTQWAGRATDPRTPAPDRRRLATGPSSSCQTASAETRAAGARIAFHPHAGTFVETPDEVDRLASSIPADVAPVLPGRRPLHGRRWRPGGRAPDATASG